MPISTPFEINSPSFDKNSDWNFARADTRKHVHGIHPYPARMIPQIADRLLDLYGPRKIDKKFTVLDPFCGSGTVIAESVILGYNATGIDINPFAILLSKAKTISKKQYESYLGIRDFITVHLDGFREGQQTYFVPNFDNIGHWFKKPVIEKLSHIHKFIEEQHADTQIVLKIALAKTIMDSSNVNWKSSRYIRVYPKEKIEYLRPRVFLIFRNSLLEIQKRLEKFIAIRKGHATLIQADARHLPVPDESIDLIITSPPYGEERNTIPYIRWSKLFLLWMNFSPDEIRNFEKIELGGCNASKLNYQNTPSPTFWRVVDGLPAERIEEAGSFIIDYLQTLREMQRKLKKEKKCCIVIGNRAIKRRYLDMGKVTIELAEVAGLKLVEEFRRKIPNKMIPWSGPTGDTISDERIVILQKE